MTTANATGDEHRRPGDWARIAIPLLVIGSLIFAAWKLGYFDMSDPERLRETTRKLRDNRWIMPAFVAVYALFVAFGVPSSPLSYVAGALFGLLRGSIIALGAAMLGAILGYVLARGVMAKPARRLLGRYKDKVTLPRGTGAFLATMRLQLLPVVPFSVSVYAAGISRVPFLQFMAATAIGTLPGTIAAVFVGSQVMSGIQGGGRKPIIIGISVAVAIFIVSLIPTIAKRMRR